MSVSYAKIVQISFNRSQRSNNDKDIIDLIITDITAPWALAL